MAKLKTGKNKVSGLKISRSGYKFTATWSINKKAKDHDVKVYINGKQIDLNGASKGQSKDLGDKTKHYTYEIDKDKYWPLKSGGSKLTSVKISVAETLKGYTQGKFKDITYKISKPGKPAYSSPAMLDSLPDTFSYSWGRNSKDKEKNIFTRYYYETILVPHDTTPTDKDWKNLLESQKITTLNPSTGVKTNDRPSKGTTTSTSIVIVEQEADISAKKRRYFRVYAQGPAGQSEARTSDHALGSPSTITVDSAIVSTINSPTDTTNGKIKFTIPKDSTTSDKVEFQYAITNPSMSTTYEPYAGEDGDGYTSITTLKAPDSFGSWETFRTFNGRINKSDSITFDFPKIVGENEALFVRFVTTHDDIKTYGEPILVNNKSEKSNIIFPLSNPTLKSVRTNIVDDVYRVQVEVEHNTSSLLNNKSYIAVYFRTEHRSFENPIGIIPYGDTTATFVLPSWNADRETPTIGIRSFVGTWGPALQSGRPYTVENQVTQYHLQDILMESPDIVWQRNAAPLPPGNLRASRHKEGIALVSWDWTWSEADSVEISWAQNIEAWDSTTEPSTYVVNNLYSSKRYIPDLSAGTWYFKARFIRTTESGQIYGAYSSAVECSMSAAPNIPTLVVDSDDNTFAIDDDITVKWGFESNDGTGQGGAEFSEAIRESEDQDWQYTLLPDSKVEDATKFTFKASSYGWENGSTHFISVRVSSDLGIASEGWSNPVPINIASIPVISISGINETENDAIRMVPVNIANEGEPEDIIQSLSLTKLPLEFTVSGAGPGGTTSVIIERAEDFTLDRPDESDFYGYEGETVVNQVLENGESDSVNVTINTDDLVGPLDDTASYRLKISITDSYGQTVEADTNAQTTEVDPYEFTVRWDHQAREPIVEITMDNENEIAIIKPIQPSVEEGYEEGDVCDIYRLSVDRPQLIGANLDFFTSEETDAYVDPYPTLGRFGGYRIVYKTKYGDYKDEDNSFSWKDFYPGGENEEYLPEYNKFAVIINFPEGTLELPGNISITNSWAKDFQLNKYLGGSIEGDWNLGVERTTSTNITIPIEYEPDSVHTLRLLADYAGVCHVRLPDGSNFYANVEVKDDRDEKWIKRLSKVSLDFNRVDGGEDDIILKSKWDELVAASEENEG